MIELDTSLHGLRVIEICNFVSGPMVGRNLASLGAEVIKIERPIVGDDGRHANPAFDGDGLFFTETGYGKKSVVLDLKTDAGLDAARRLIDTADVLLENMRPSVMARIGLGAEQLLSSNPKLIIASVSAFEASSPRHDDPAYDPVIQAATGIMFANVLDNEPPRRIGASIVDKTTALWSTIQVLAALQQRERTGKGGHITVSMLSAAVHMMGADILRFLATGAEVAPSHQGGGASHGAYQAADGRWIQVAIGNDRMYERLCRAAGHEELLEDPRFKTQLTRGEHRVAENAAMAAVIAERPSAEWVELLKTIGIPYALINHISEFVEDTELSGAFLQQGGRSDGTPVPFIRGPLDPVETSKDHRRLPRLGEDTETVLRDVLGLGDVEYEELAERGAFGSDAQPGVREGADELPSGAV